MREEWEGVRILHEGREEWEGVRILHERERGWSEDTA